MAIVITYDLEGSVFDSGTEGDRWTRLWSASGIDAPDYPTAVRDLYLALPNPGTPAPAPLLQTTTIRNTVIDNVWNLLDPATGLQWANGQATGREVYSSPIDVRAEPPPDDLEPDTGPGFTLAGRGYIEERQYFDARLPGTDTVEQVYTEWTDGVLVATPFLAPMHGEAFTFVRNERTNPRARLSSYRGRVNSGVWNGYAAERVLLQDASFETVNGAEYYAVTYQFVVAPDVSNLGWNVEVYGRDHKTGRPILNPTGDQSRTYIPYQRVDFSPLNIVLG